MKILMPDIMKVEYNTRVLQEAFSLKKNGYKVNVVGFSNHDKTFEKIINGIGCYSIYLNDNRSGFKKIFRYFTALKMILGINFFILKSDYDFYHAHNFHVLPASVISAKIRGKKIVYDTHETWTIHRGKKYHPEHIFAYIFEKLFIKYIDGFVTVNEMVKHYYEDKFGVKNGIVLYNTHPIKPLMRPKLFYAELGIDRDKKIVLFQGGLYGNFRGIINLIEASRYITEEVIVVFLGFGSPEMIKNMRDKIRRYGLGGKIFILPPKDPSVLLNYTMSADIGMNLINRLGRAQDFQSPWKLFEYCMAGLAVISTDLPFHRIIHEKYSIGPIIEKQNNPLEIAEKINDLIHDEKELTKCKIRSRLAAEAQFNWKQQEIKLIKFYNLVKSL